MRQAGIIAGIVIALLLVGAPALANSNNPNYWGEDCYKIDEPGGLTWVSDDYYRLVVLKAATVDYVYEHVEPGDVLATNGKHQISHMILCPPYSTTLPEPSTTTTVPPTTTTSSTTTVPPSSTTTLPPTSTTTTVTSSTTTSSTTPTTSTVPPSTVPTTTTPTTSEPTLPNTGVDDVGGLAMAGAALVLLGLTAIRATKEE